MSTTFSKRLAVGTLMIAVLASSASTLFPQRAHAQFGGIVLDPTNLIQNTATAIAAVGTHTKEFVLDPIAWIVAKAAVASLTQSTVNWINSGFNGSPAFVTDLKRNLLRVADYQASQFFDEISNNIIDSPYGDQISTAIRTGYYLSTGGQFYVKNPFTLNQYSNNPSGFIGGDFAQGGYGAFFSTIVNQQNNPYGAYQIAAGELDRRLAAAGSQRVTELNWGQGFLGFRDCQDAASAITVALTDVDSCQNETIKTPGTVISSRLNQSLGLGDQSLVTADEIDEIIGALFTQLTKKVLGSGGLLGVSAASSGGGASYIDRAVQEQSGLGNTTASGSAVSQTELLQYQSNWQKVYIAAQDALSRCPTNATAQSAATSATSALAKASTALAIYDSSGASSITYAAAAPSTAEVAAAATNAATGGNSLYEQLQDVQDCVSQ